MITTFCSIRSLTFVTSSIALSQCVIRISHASFPHVAWLVLSESVDYSQTLVSSPRSSGPSTYQNTELIKQISSSTVVSTAELLLPKVIEHIDHFDGDLSLPPPH